MFKPKSAAPTGFFISALSCALIFGSYAIYKIIIMPNKKRKTEKVIAKPEKWVRVGVISKLIIYPIKSCQGIEVEQAKLTPLGLQGLISPEFLRDRIFVITNSQGVFQTQRNYPTLTLIQVTITDDSKLILGTPDRESIVCDLKNLSPAKHALRVWTDHFDNKDILDLGDEVGKWLDNFLNETGFRIIFHSATTTKRVMTTQHKRFPLFVPEDLGTFQDETAYMLMSSESIEALNSKLETKVSYKNFRPTLFVDHIPEPFSEDDWSFIRVGDKTQGPILKACMPCLRCRLTTVDPNTGIFNPDGEPVKTIHTLKRPVADAKTTELTKKSAVLGIHFGMYEGADSVINVGDNLYAALL